MKTIEEIVVPKDAGTCTDRFLGTAPFSFFLVDSQAGHPAKAERKVLATLESLHALRPIDRVFIDFDASGKAGSHERDIDVGPYRAYPDRAITKGITQSIIDQDLLSGGMAFAIVCEPAAHLEAIDDWYGWSSQRDALDQLNSEVGKIVLAAQLSEALIPADSDRGQRAAQLVALVLLRFTAAEWQTERAALSEIDPDDTLADLRESMPEFDTVVEAFVRYKEIAIRFYEGTTARVHKLSSEAIKSMQDSGAATGAIVHGVQWMDLTTMLLRTENVGFVRVTPDDIERTSVLDEASVNLGDLTESTRRLGQLFSGERVTDRTRIEALAAKDEESKKRRADELVGAGRRLSLEGEVEKATELFERAIEMHPDAETLIAGGGHAADHGEFPKAVALFESALKLDPKSASAWEGYGVALRGIGQHDRARKAITTGVYLEPRNGRIWGQLGFHLYNRGIGKTACYCFEKGKALGDLPSSQNFDTVCGPGTRSSVSFSLRPAVIFIMRSFVLPLRRRLGQGGPLANS